MRVFLDLIVSCFAVLAVYTWRSAPFWRGDRVGAGLGRGERIARKCGERGKLCLGCII